MSSDGSVSSRISEFGLYRTIDARTEEFLKLSKKRQIRQGCVCAAISTALTVTVVVTILLIYEYNVIAEAKRNYKANWLDLMNNSADDSSLLQRLNKEQLQIDRTTLKLLPILLKALEQNKYVEKLIEEPTSLFPTYENEGVTETSLTKNVFADTRNWMKTPNSRHFTLEYKTSPIVYFKNPTRSTEYFTKIRKIRDYQRMLKYVDKMINEKSSIGTTPSMKKHYSHTEKPHTATTPFSNMKVIQKKLKKQTTFPKAKEHEKSTNCKCSNKLSNLMTKLLSSIEKLLKYFSISNTKEKQECLNSKDNILTENKHLNISNKKIKTSTVKKSKTFTEKNVIYEPPLTRKASYKNFLNRHKYTIDLPSTRNIDIRRDHTINTIMSLIRPNFDKHNNIDISFDSKETLGTTDSYIKSADKNEIVTTSKLYPKYVDQINSKTQANFGPTEAYYTRHMETYDAMANIKTSHSTFFESDFSDDDFTETPQATISFGQDLNELDTFGRELVKSNLLPQRKNYSAENKSYSLKGTRNNKTSYDNIASMRKAGNLASNHINSSILLSKLYRFAPISKTISKPTTTTTITTTTTSHSTEATSFTNYKTNAVNAITATKEDKQSKTVYSTTTINKDVTIKQKDIDDVTTENQNTNVKKENNSNETALQHLEEAIMILQNETMEEKLTENHKKTTAEIDQWHLVKMEENTSAKSMVPLSRSTYLEMQRHDWKQDENHDFDNDMNNYVFD